MYIFVVIEPPQNPCIPSPCGPYSQCSEVNSHGVCSCLPNYIGTPPACRPECTSSSECSPDRACINQKCVDPCPGTCGQNARCHVTNHNPICSCSPRFTGDPFVRCLPEESKRCFSTRSSGQNGFVNIFFSVIDSLEMLKIVVSCDTKILIIKTADHVSI